MHLRGKYQGEPIAPLEELTLVGAQSGTITIEDSQRRVYIQAPAQSQFTFMVAGALGQHQITLTDSDGNIQDQMPFRVDAQTRVNDIDGFYSKLLEMLFMTMVANDGTEYHYIRYNGRIYNFFIRWLRDHVHALKGMKYFHERLYDGIDLFHDSQREDGMIWDNVLPKEPPIDQLNHWASRFDEDGFYRAFPDFTGEFKRIPVENDVEYLYIEGLYFTWKATGDDAWMSNRLDSAMQALDYSMNDPLRWSEKYQLLKRGYTIDTWDFQCQEDCILGWGDPMRVDKDRTRFGVMFGDNTGYAMACGYLAEMLERAGRAEEAAAYRQRGQEIKARLDEVSWNGHFYRHHVPEQEGLTRNLGVDEASQVSLSNAYSLNRSLTHEQCVAIIKTYQGIRANLPEGSPGEWYTIYPPFERGFGGHGSKYQYMNAGVTTIVAGELAHGAFEHGYEDYAVDILRRLHDLGRAHGDIFFSVYTGAAISVERNFRPLDLEPFATNNTNGLPGWPADFPTGEQEFTEVPFVIPANGYIGLSKSIEDFRNSLEVPVHDKAASLYLLHAAHQIDTVAGKVTLHYVDGSAHTTYITQGKNILPWNTWQYLKAPNARKSNPTTQIAWRVWDDDLMNKQLLTIGIDNPQPEMEIDHITLEASESIGLWAVIGLSLSDYRVHFKPNPISGGIPNSWGAGAVIYALIEGLAGVVDQDTAYRQAQIAPRWIAAHTDEVQVTVKYPASDGYVSYHYRHDQTAKQLHLTLTGSGQIANCHMLLPSPAQQVEVDGTSVEFHTSVIEQSHYVDFSVELPQAHKIIVSYA